MDIYIKTIKQSEQRLGYPYGDYWFDGNDDLQIRVTDFKNPKVEFLIALHELCEVMLVRQRGISIKEIEDFDVKFEEEKSRGKYSQDMEPGDHPEAPYRKEHFFATNIERLMAEQMNFDWLGWTG